MYIQLWLRTITWLDNRKIVKHAILNGRIISTSSSGVRHEPEYLPNVRDCYANLHHYTSVSISGRSNVCFNDTSKIIMNFHFNNASYIIVYQKQRNNNKNKIKTVLIKQTDQLISELLKLIHGFCEFFYLFIIRTLTGIIAIVATMLW